MQKLENFFISSKDSRIENPHSFYGCFYLGPFKPSQSLTIANALRRTLLSEIRGIAISAVYIEGADHEYSTLPGVKDSVLDILLNLKDIVLTELSSSPDSLNSGEKKTMPVLGYLQVRGPGKIYASDLKLPTHIQCVDPNQYIASLSQNGSLNAKFLISDSPEGASYQIQTPKKIQEFLKKNESENSVLKEASSDALLSHLKSMVPLTLDPVFTPIQKVNYTIENDEYYMIKETSLVEKENGGAGSLQKPQEAGNIIVLEIWTNGSLHPRDALTQAIQQLLLLLSSLSEMTLIQNSMATSIRESTKNIQKMVSKIESPLSSSQNKK